MNNDNKLLIEYAIEKSERFDEYHYSPSQLQKHKLKKRKERLNKSFEFTPENIGKLDEFVNTINTKTKWAFEQGLRLKKYVETEMEKPDSFIEDYEIESELSLYSVKLYDDDEDLAGDPFYVSDLMLSVKHDIDNKEWLFETNHNKFERYDINYPLKHQWHCYFVHDMLEHHSILAWQDILATERIWVDVSLKVQTMKDF